MGISYYFTTQNTKKSGDGQANDKTAEPPPRTRTFKSDLFIGIAIPVILLNTGASFFGMYTGTLLLAAALGTPIAPAAIITISIVLASILALSTLINSWLQAHHLWEGFKKPGEKTAENTPRQTLERDLEKGVAPEIKKRPGITPIPPYKPQSLPQKLARRVCGFFGVSPPAATPVPASQLQRRMSAPARL